MHYGIKSNIIFRYPGIEQIHPLKQKQLEETILFTHNNYPTVKYIAVFGSAVDGRCRDVSDIDICVWGGKECHFCPPDNDVYDVIFAEDLSENSPLRDEINEEGVVVYARDLDSEITIGSTCS